MSTTLSDAVESILTAGPDEGQPPAEPPVQDPAEEPTDEPTGDEDEDYDEDEYGDDDADESDDSDEDDDDDDEYDDDADDDADPDETEYHTVKVDGKDEQVTLEDLKQGFSGQKFIQKGMKENAEARKQIEQASHALQAQMQQVTQLHQQLSQQGIIAEPKPPVAADFDNPLDAVEAQMNYTEQKAKYDDQQAKLQGLRQQQQQVQQAQVDNYRREQAAKLVEKMPEIKDPKTLADFQARINKGGSEHYGFDANEIAQMFDHRAYLVIDDALKYRELMAGQEKAAKKTKKARKMVKPGAKKAPKRVAKKRQDQQRAKFQKTGRINDAVDLILN